MSCETCRYFEPGGGKFSKGYCTYYRSYVYPSDSCAKYEGSSSGGCFLTTACCDHKGLPDDCPELRAMRKLRDYIKKEYTSAQKCVDIYYKAAPIIVKNINQRVDRDDCLEEIYKYVLHIKALMDNDDIMNAAFEYMYLFCECLQKYSE